MQLSIRAATIDERLSSMFKIADKHDSRLPDAAKDRIDAWRESATAGDFDLFAKRLKRDAIDSEWLNDRFGEVEYTNDSQLPSWVNDAAWITQSIAVPDALVDTSLGFSTNFPFEDLYRGLVEEAERRRNLQLPSHIGELVADAAILDIRMKLIKELTELGSLLLYEEFCAFRNSFGQPKSGGNSANIYMSFVNNLKTDGLKEIFDAKPVFLRLLAGIVRQWIDATAEFLERLVVDWASIRSELFDASDTCRVESIRMNNSDPHNFGRSVYVVELSDSRKFVYKPRDVRSDVNWGNLIAWLKRERSPITLVAPRVLQRESYGWFEFVNSAECGDEIELRAFYERAGGLLGLWYILAGSDMHEENIIAAASNPVPVDLETVFHASVSADTGEATPFASLEKARMRLANSVLSTGILPTFTRNEDGTFSLSGGMHGNNNRRVSTLIWRQPNTDSMKPQMQNVASTQLSSNVPSLAGRKRSLAKHVDDFCRGFSQIMKFVMRNKSKLLAVDGPLEAFRGDPVRLIIRPTRFYVMLLRRLRDHRRMHDGVIWSANLDFISRLADWEHDNEPLWPLVAFERESLTNFNIPFFSHSNTGGTIFSGENSTIVDATSGFSEARRRIDKLSAESLEWQLGVVRTSIRASFDISESTSEVGNRSKISPRCKTLRSPLADLAAAAAEDIFNGIDQCSISDTESISWIGLDPVSRRLGYNLAVLGNDLYSGAPGIALAFSAHYQIYRSQRSADIASKAIAPLRHQIKGLAAARLGRAMGIGGGTGLGSIIYTLTSVGDHLGDEGIILDTKTALQLIDAQQIANDNEYDVIGGAAGCILGLLKLFRITEYGMAMERAVLCAEHLLRNLDKFGFDSKSNRIPGGTVINGMSHGIGGLAYALSALGKASTEQRFTDAASLLTTCEDDQFVASRQNWPGLPKYSESHEWPCQWCVGASGIGMARIGMNRFGGFPYEEIKLTLDRAIDAVVQNWPRDWDSLCCGNVGNIELLNEASRFDTRDVVRPICDQQLRAVLENASKTGAFRWGVGRNVDNLGFFQGQAGIAYTLLRFAYPKRLPNVLLWE